MAAPSGRVPRIVITATRRKAVHRILLMMFFISICALMKMPVGAPTTSHNVSTLHSIRSEWNVHTWRNRGEASDGKENYDDSSSKLVILLLKQPLPVTVKIHRLGISSSRKNHAFGAVDEDTRTSLATCPHTMVTAYFSIPSKFTSSQYLQWMSNFLSVQDCMVIFTSSDMLDTIREFRAASLTKTVFIVMSVEDVPIAQIGKGFWENQLKIDPEKKIHRSYQLFWIWLSKSWFVVQAIQEDFFGTRTNPKGLFMWQDIGSYRNTNYNGQTILVHTDVVPAKTILWMAHHRTNPPPDPIWNAKFKQRTYYFHSGSQGAGDSEAWLEFHEKFAETIRQFLARQMFIGEDQCVLQSTCQQYPNLCAYIQATQVSDNHYFGLRYALVHGGNYDLWRMPTVDAAGGG